MTSDMLDISSATLRPMWPLLPKLGDFVGLVRRAAWQSVVPLLLEELWTLTTSGNLPDLAVASWPRSDFGGSARRALWREGMRLLGVFCRARLRCGAGFGNIAAATPTPGRTSPPALGPEA